MGTFRAAKVLSDLAATSQQAHRSTKVTKPVLGLLGGIGSGKSTAAAAFARHGGLVIDADRLGHDALKQPELRERLVARFGTDILDSAGAIDRRKLGPKVFADPAERQALEAVVHPWIGQRIMEEIARAQATPEIAFIVLDAAIMLETGWNKVCDSLVYVDVPRTLRLQRLAQTRGWTEAELARRERAQLPLEEKARQADYTLDNSGSAEATARQVHDLLHRLAKPPSP